MEEFNIGDYVKWETKSHGITVKRTGKVVYIVEPFVTLEEIDYDVLSKSASKVFNIISNGKVKIQ